MNTSANRPELTRASAYNYLGKPHFIPMKMGVSWLKSDLVDTLERLPLGGSTILDYRGDVLDAPHFSLVRSLDDQLTLRSLDQPLDAVGNSAWTWPPSALPDRNVWIAYDILTVILERRRAPWVMLIPPAHLGEE